MDKVIGYIYETKDYSKFKKLGGNRFVDHSDKIVESIQKYGQLMSPIVVNEDYETIDGQNRFAACEKLNLPIQYTIQKGYGISECIAMNSVSKNWTTRDYIQSYSDLGNKDYKALKELLDKYSGRIDTSTIIAIASGNIDFYSKGRIIDGAFKIGTEGVEFYDKMLQYLAQFDVSKIKGNSNRIYKIIAFCYREPSIDNDKLLSFFQKYSYQIEAVVDTRQAGEAIERIYNFKCNKTNYIFINSMYMKYALERNVVYAMAKKEDNNERNIGKVKQNTGKVKGTKKSIQQVW